MPLYVRTHNHTCTCTQSYCRHLQIGVTQLLGLSMGILLNLPRISFPLRKARKPGSLLPGITS